MSYVRDTEVKNISRQLSELIMWRYMFGGAHIIHSTLEQEVYTRANQLVELIRLRRNNRVLLLARVCGETARKSPTACRQQAVVQAAVQALIRTGKTPYFPSFIFLTGALHGPVNQQHRVIAVQQLEVATSFASCSRMARPVSLFVFLLELIIIQSALHKQQLQITHHMSTPSKSNNNSHLSAEVQLEKAAKKLTLYSRALREQLMRLREQVVIEKQAVQTSEDDVSESSARLQEIEELMAKLQQDVNALRMMPPSHDDGSLAAREQEIEELEEERREELELLAHIQTMLQMHQNMHSKVKRMIATLTKEIRRVRQREEVVVLAALRCRAVKVFASKI